MTLCIAWIRQVGETEELVVATDSSLTGGEKWNGIKLFELPRKDCFICFAGETYRAYPLILNLISMMEHDEKLYDYQKDIQELVYDVVDIFNEMILTISDRPKGNALELGSEAKFLFGGWSWKDNRFRIWRLAYAPDARAFVPKEETTPEEKSRVCIFLGDPEGDVKKEERNISVVAEKKYKDELISRDKFDGRLDMEPLNVLVELSRDPGVYEVDKALQIVKIYKSGTNEFFGIMWPSIKGTHTFLGKTYDKHNKPNVRFIDPDTCEIIEDIPKCLANIEDFSGTEYYEFLKSCYSQEDNFLKQDISDKEKDKLVSIFREYTYSEFLKVAEENKQL